MSRFINIGTIVSVLSVIYLVGANTNVKITAPQTNPGLVLFWKKKEKIKFSCEKWSRLLKNCFVNKTLQLEHPNMCWDSASQIAYSIGSHNAKNSCQRVHCYPDYRMKYTS